VVIGTDYIGHCKSNYHANTATTGIARERERYALDGATNQDEN